MRNILLLLVTLAVRSVTAQVTYLGQLSGPGTCGPYDAVGTPDGGQVLCGIFDDVVDLDPGSGVFTVTSAGSSDAWVAKYDVSGALVWGFAIGGTGLDQARAITIDENGHLHVAGGFEGAVDLDPGTGISTVTSAGDWDIFWLKLDENGQHLWSGRMGGPARQFPTDIDRDLAGHIYLCGWNMGSSDLDPGAGALNVTTTNTGTAYEANISFLAKYDLGGDPVWANSLGGFTPHIAVEQGGNAIYYTSSNEATPLTEEDFDPTGGTLPPLASTDPAADYMALLRYDANGEVVWSTFQRGYADFDQDDNKGNALALDMNGDVYWAGEFINNMSQYPGNDLTLDAPGTGRDGFLVKYSSAGSFVWEKRFGATNMSDFCDEVHTATNGTVWVAGGFGNTAELNSAGPSVQVTSAGGNDIFLVAFDQGGAYLWSGTVGGSSFDGTAQLTDHNGTIRLSGYFSATADCDVTSAVGNLTSAGGSDVFLSAFGPGINVGMPAAGADQDLSVFPNPADDELRMTIDIGPFEVHDAYGRCVLSSRSPGPIDVSDWPEGSYVLHGRSGRHGAVHVLVRH